MQDFIYNEALSGAVDGVNKTFVSVSPIAAVESLRLGGAEYTSFSFNGSVVTLADAPTPALGAPRLDYFVEGVSPTPPDGTVTFASLVNDIYLSIGQEEGTQQYPSELVRKWLKKTIPIHVNRVTDPVRKLGSYCFSKEADMRATAYSATEVDVGTVPVGTPSSGKIIVRNANVIGYTWTTASAFTGLSGISIAYESGDSVKVGYKVPNGVSKVSKVYMDGVELLKADTREFVTADDFSYYAIIDGYLFLPTTNRKVTIVVTYNKPAHVPVANDDIIDFREGYEMVLAYDTLRRLYVDREDTRLANVTALYNEAYNDYKSFVARQTDTVNGIMRATGFEKTNQIPYGYGRRY